MIVRWVKIAFFIAFCCFSIANALAKVTPKPGYTFVFLHINPNHAALNEQGVAILKKNHNRYIQQGMNDNMLLATGIFDDGDRMLILNTTFIATAEKWVNQMPLILEGVYFYEVFSWTPRVGNVCLATDTTNTIDYTFVKYSTQISKHNVRQVPQLLIAHDEYLKKISQKLTVISEGYFGNDDGGILILQERLDEDIINNDPTVTNGFIIPKVKIVRVNQGVFCEK